MRDDAAGAGKPTEDGPPEAAINGDNTPSRRLCRTRRGSQRCRVVTHVRAKADEGRLIGKNRLQLIGRAGVPREQ